MADRSTMKAHSQDCPYDKVKSFLVEYKKIQKENKDLKDKVETLEKLAGRSHVHLLTRYYETKGMFYSYPYKTKSYCCNVCKLVIAGAPTYHCDICKNYDVCPNCWHPHQLKKMKWDRDLSVRPEYSNGVMCDECGKTGKDTIYHCDTCGDFDLCQSCTGVRG